MSAFCGTLVTKLTSSGPPYTFVSDGAPLIFVIDEALSAADDDRDPPPPQSQLNIDGGAAASSSTVAFAKGFESTPFAS